MVAGIGRVDGDEGDLAQVLATLEGRQGLIEGLLFNGVGEAGRHAVGVDGDQGGGPGVVFAPDGFQNLAAFGPVALLALLDRGQNEVSVAQIGGLQRWDDQHVLRAPVDRLDPGFLVGFADHAEDSIGAGVQRLDQPRFPAVLTLDEFDQQSVAHARGGGGPGAALGHQHGARRVG